MQRGIVSLGADDAVAATDAFDEALTHGRGSAYQEFSAAEWATSETARLDELHATAIEQRAAAIVRRGLAAAVVTDLRVHVAAHPLREEGWRLLRAGALPVRPAGRRPDGTPGGTPGPRGETRRRSRLDPCGGWRPTSSPRHRNSRPPERGSGCPGSGCPAGDRSSPRCWTTRCGLALVSGEAGMGKSDARGEAAVRFARRGRRVVTRPTGDDLAAAARSRPLLIVVEDLPAPTTRRPGPCSAWPGTRRTWTTILVTYREDDSEKGLRDPGGPGRTGAVTPTLPGLDLRRDRATCCGTCAGREVLAATVATVGPNAPARPLVRPRDRLRLIGEKGEAPPRREIQGRPRRAAAAPARPHPRAVPRGARDAAVIGRRPMSTSWRRSTAAARTPWSTRSRPPSPRAWSPSRTSVDAAPPALVHDLLDEDMSRLRRARTHAWVGSALEHLGPNDDGRAWPLRRTAASRPGRLLRLDPRGRPGRGDPDAQGQDR